MIGPAGSGKTALLAEWFHADRDHQAAWLHVDESDRDPVRFWRAFVTAIRTCRPEFASGFLDLLRLQPAIDPDVLEHVLEGAHALDAPVALVVDDLHLAASEVYEHLRFLLSRELGPLRIVIGTRKEPPIGLHRLRLDDRVTELREADLRFERRDAVRMLRGLGIQLPDESITIVLDRTEGWAAGLQLVGLAARDADDQADVVSRLSGTNQVIAQYLAAEVFAAQTTDVQRFLLDTCVVDELTPDLAGVLSPGNPVTLLDVEAAHLFVRRVDPDGQTFRYHHLLIGMLRYHLRAVDAVHESELHDRAARWFETHGDPVAAFRHHWRAGHREAALHAIHGTVLDVVYEALPTMPALERTLSDDDIRSAPGPAASFATALITSGLPADAQRLAKRIRATATVTDDLDDDLDDQLVAIEAMTDLILGDTRRAVEHLAHDGARPGSDEIWPVLTRLAVAKARVWEGDLDLATTELSRLDAPDALPLVRMEIGSTTAHIQLAAGHLTACERTLTALLDEVDADDHGPVADGVLARALLGTLMAERAELDAAERMLRPLREARSEFRVPAMVVATVGLSRVWLANGLIDSANVAIGDVYNLVRARPPRSGLLDHIRDHQVRVLLAGRNVDEAAVVLAEIELGHRRRLLEAELALAQGDPERARAALAGVPAASPTSIRAQLEQALLGLRIDEATGADPTAHTQTALELAVSERFLLPLVEAGTEALLAVQAQARQVPRNTTVDLLLRLRPRVTSGDGAGSDGPTSLTEREIAILRYMATSMSYREVAEELYVSLNTVKTHVKHINRKLQATSRSETVERARELNYL